MVWSLHFTCSFGLRVVDESTLDLRCIYIYLIKEREFCIYIYNVCIYCPLSKPATRKPWHRVVSPDVFFVHRTMPPAWCAAASAVKFSRQFCWAWIFAHGLPIVERKRGMGLVSWVVAAIVDKTLGTSYEMMMSQWRSFSGSRKLMPLDGPWRAMASSG